MVSQQDQQMMVGVTAAFNSRERVSIPKKRNAMMKMIAP